MTTDSGGGLVVPSTRTAIAAQAGVDEAQPFLAEGVALSLVGWTTGALFGVDLHVQRLDSRTGAVCAVEVVDAPRNFASRAPRAVLEGGT